MCTHVCMHMPNLVQCHVYAWRHSLAGMNESACVHACVHACVSGFLCLCVCGCVCVCVCMHACAHVFFMTCQCSYVWSASPPL